MASTTDSRASAFSATTFRDAIRFAMNMGLPQDTTERVTFRWTAESTYSIADPGGNPYSWSASPVTTIAPADVQIDAAVEFIARSTMSGGSAVADFDTPRAVITVLDEDYVDVEGADKVLLGGNTYNVDYVAPPIGLFGVTVYQIHASAVDES